MGVVDSWGFPGQCYNSLTEWSDLEKAAIVNIDDSDPPCLDKIWEDAYYLVWSLLLHVYGCVSIHSVVNQCTALYILIHTPTSIIMYSVIKSCNLVGQFSVSYLHSNLVPEGRYIYSKHQRVVE